MELKAKISKEQVGKYCKNKSYCDPKNQELAEEVVKCLALAHRLELLGYKAENGVAKKETKHGNCLIYYNENGLLSWFYNVNDTIVSQKDLDSIQIEFNNFNRDIRELKK